MPHIITVKRACAEKTENINYVPLKNLTTIFKNLESAFTDTAKTFSKLKKDLKNLYPLYNQMIKLYNNHFNSKTKSWDSDKNEKEFNTLKNKWNNTLANVTDSYIKTFKPTDPSTDITKIIANSTIFIDKISANLKIDTPSDLTNNS